MTAERALSGEPEQETRSPRGDARVRAYFGRELTAKIVDDGLVRRSLFVETQSQGSLSLM